MKIACYCCQKSDSEMKRINGHGSTGERKRERKGKHEDIIAEEIERFTSSSRFELQLISNGCVRNDLCRHKNKTGRVRLVFMLSPLNAGYNDNTAAVSLPNPSRGTLEVRESHVIPDDRVRSQRPSTTRVEFDSRGDAAIRPCLIPPESSSVVISFFSRLFRGFSADN